MNIKSIAKGVKHFCVKYAPEIVTTIGAGTIATGSVMAYRSVKKTRATIEDATERFEKLKEYADGIDIPVEQCVRDKRIIVKSAAKDIAKTVLPTVAVLSTGVFAFCTGLRLFRRRYISAVAAASALSADFAAYRSRVVDKYGEDVDDQLMNGWHDEAVTTSVVDPETGEVTEKTEVKKVADKDAPLGDYIWFGPTIPTKDGSTIPNPCWEPGDMNANLVAVARREAIIANQVRRNGAACLNDALRLLGYPVVKDGYAKGWNDPKDVKFIFDHRIENLIQSPDGAILVRFNCKPGFAEVCEPVNFIGPGEDLE